MKSELRRKQLARQAVQMVWASQPEDFRHLTVNWIARELGVSVPNLFRACKQEIGMSLQQYLFFVRIEHCLILFKTDPVITVKEVAALVDYSSSKYLSKIFKQCVGITPRKFFRIAHNRPGK